MNAHRPTGRPDITELAHQTEPVQQVILITATPPRCVTWSPELAELGLVTALREHIDRLTGIGPARPVSGWAHCDRPGA
jgi:hypothetical protein